MSSVTSPVLEVREGGTESPVINQGETERKRGRLGEKEGGGRDVVGGWGGEEEGRGSIGGRLGGCRGRLGV